MSVDTVPMVITPYMEKGGVGKTTSTAALGYSLAKYGKVLLCDGDPQGNLTQQLMDDETFRKSKKEYLGYLEGRLLFDDAIICARPASEGFSGIDILGTKHHDEKLKTYIEGEFRNNPIKVKILVKEAQKRGYSFIIFDLPASFGFYTKSIIALCDQVIPVVQLEEFGMSGFLELLNELKLHREGFDAHYDIAFTIANMYDKKLLIHREYLQRFSESPFQVFVCNKSADIPNSAAFHQIIHEFKKTNAAVQVFDELARALINKKEAQNG